MQQYAKVDFAHSVRKSDTSDTFCALSAQKEARVAFCAHLCEKSFGYELHTQFYVICMRKMLITLMKTFRGLQFGDTKRAH